MYNVRRMVLICTGYIMRTFSSCKIYVAMFIIFVLFQQLTAGINAFSRIVDIKVNGFIYPLVTYEKFVQVIIILGAAFIMGDVPFDDESNEWQIIRIGRKQWISSKILYVLIISIIISLCIYMISCLSLIPNLQFELDWGKVIYTLAQTNAAKAVGVDVIGINYEILLKLKPISACVMNMGITSLILFFLGLTITLGNLILRKCVGQIVGFGIAFMALVAPNFSKMFMAYYFSPASWINISFWITNNETRYPTVQYMIMFLLIGIIVMILLILLITGTNKWTIEKSRW